MKKLITVVFTLSSIFAQTLTMSAADIRDGLVSFWPFETINGATTPDLAYTNNLNLVNAPTLVAGTNGQAFSFNSASLQYLTMSHTTNNAINGLPIMASGRYTVAMWVKAPPAQGNRYLFSESQSTSTGGPLLLLQTINTTGSFTNKLNIFLRNSAGTALVNNLKSGSVVFDNTWHHIAWVDDLGNAKLYVDGELDPTNFTYTATAGSFAIDTTSIGALVRASVSGHFTGVIDEVALWERALTQAEVRQIRTNGIATPIPQTLPIFAQQPLGSTNAMGDRVTFSASAIGTHPMTYQWFKDGAPIANATNITLILTDLTTSTTNIYRVDATNPLGTTPSANATLVVLPDPVSNIPSSLLSYWPFNTVDANTNTPDLYSHNDMKLNLMDANNLGSGQFGNALSFTNSYVNRVGGFPVFNNTNYSISLWVNGAANQTNKQIYAEGNNTNTGIFFFLGTDALGTSGLVNMKASTGLVDRKSTRVAFDGLWHHLVWVDENGKGKLYVDGVLDETDYTYTRSTLALNNTAVGGLLRSTAANFFTGSVDEVAVWNRRLTYTEILEIKNLGVPAPVGAIPPSISSQPVSQTNNVFTGDTVNFSAQATGTSPLSYRWSKNGLPIDGTINPSALTNVLTLSNVQASDSANYFLTVTNEAGTTNSITVQLVVTSYTPTTNGTVLNLDFERTDTPNTQPGFSRMTLGLNPTNFNGVNITLSTIGSTTLGERLRSSAVNNPPNFTQAQLYNDFIFSSSATDNTGMKILIERLAPNTQYGLTVWSWDDLNNTGSRVSDWIETASGSSAVIHTGYTFDGSFNPTHDFTNTFGALLTSSATGKLQIEGRKKPGAGISVFVNGLRLVANPIMKVNKAEIINGNVRLTIETQYPNQPITIQEKIDLGSGTWSTPVIGGVIQTDGPIVIAEFPASASQTFYRVTSP